MFARVRPSGTESLLPKTIAMILHVHPHMSGLCTMILLKCIPPTQTTLANPCRRNLYDQAVEYWITVRETGSYEEEHEAQQRHSTKSEVHPPVRFNPQLLRFIDGTT